MPDTLILFILFLLLGLLIGGLSAWLIAKYRFRTMALSSKEVEEQFVRKEIYDALQLQTDLYRDESMTKSEEITLLTGRLSAKEQILLNLEDKLNGQKEEIIRMQERSKLEFENLANRLLEEKSQKFTDQNQKHLNDILQPLREKIKSFEEGVEKRFLEETKDRVSLKKEIEQLRELNQQLSLDASNLANALKGDNKTQGDWGELQLEMLLQKAGLQKGLHYQSQSSFTDLNGKIKRPDFIINLPDKKHLIIDSKVSLKAYEKFFNAEKEQKSKYLKAHINSMRNHLKELNEKNYQNLYQIHSPDYLLMFVPIEPAFSIALQEDNQLFLDALDKNIVLVTNSTLLATMRTVSFIWKQEKQKRSVLEIARQSGLLYDKFCAFVDDLKEIGQRLDQTRNAYHGAMNKLVDSKKFGDTLVGRAQRIKELGAKTHKNLPADWLESGQEEEE